MMMVVATTMTTMTMADNDDDDDGDDEGQTMIWRTTCSLFAILLEMCESRDNRN